MYIETFKRIEKKFILNKNQYENLLEKIKPYMQLDEYGLTTICNQYFDDDMFNLTRTSIDKPIYKEKLRLRSYGTPTSDTKCFLEIKKKYKGIVYKRRIGAPLHEIEEYLNNSTFPPSCDNKQILKEIDYFIKFHSCVPKVFLAYDRMAFYGKQDKTFRMTIDANIRSRTNSIDLKNGDIGKILQKDMFILEVKVQGAFPLWLTNILTELEIYPTSFSKIGEVYKKEIINTKEEIKNVRNTYSNTNITNQLVACY